MSETRLELREALDIVADGGPTLDVSDLKALRVIVHFAIDHMDCRRVLSVPTEEMVEAAAKALFDETRLTHPDTWETAPERSREANRGFVRAALAAAFNTLGIQEKADTTLNK
jgi:hypothetical protein